MASQPRRGPAGPLSPEGRGSRGKEGLGGVGALGGACEQILGGTAESQTRLPQSTSFLPQRSWPPVRLSKHFGLLPSPGSPTLAALPGRGSEGPNCRSPTSPTRLSRSACVRLTATTRTPAAHRAWTVLRPMPVGSSAQRGCTRLALDPRLSTSLARSHPPAHLCRRR